MNLTIELDKEHDGRWTANVIDLPGVMCYRATQNEAISRAKNLAIPVISDRIAHHELPTTGRHRSL